MTKNDFDLKKFTGFLFQPAKLGQKLSGSSDNKLLERSSLGQKSLASVSTRHQLWAELATQWGTPTFQSPRAILQQLKVPNISRQNCANLKSEWKKMFKSCQSVAIKIKNMPLEHHKSQKTSWSTESETYQKCQKQKHWSSSHLFARRWDWDSFLKKHSSAGNTLHPPCQLSVSTLVDIHFDWHAKPTSVL